MKSKILTSISLVFWFAFMLMCMGCINLTMERLDDTYGSDSESSCYSSDSDGCNMGSN